MHIPRALDAQQQLNVTTPNHQLTEFGYTMYDLTHFTWLQTQHVFQFPKSDGLEGREKKKSTE